MNVISRDEVLFGHACALCQMGPADDERQWKYHNVEPEGDGRLHPMHVDCYQQLKERDDPCPTCRAPLKGRVIPLPAEQQNGWFSSSVDLVRRSIRPYLNARSLATVCGLSLAAYSMHVDQRLSILSYGGSVFLDNALNIGSWLGCNFAYLVNGSPNLYNKEVIGITLANAGMIVQMIRPSYQWFVPTFVLAAIAQFAFNNMSQASFNSTNNRIMNKIAPVNNFILDLCRVYLISTLFSVLVFPSEESKSVLNNILKFKLSDHVK